MQRGPQSSREQQVHYFDQSRGPSRHRAPDPPYRGGEAGFVWLSEEETFETDTRVVLTPNTYHSLVAHGVVDQLALLKIQMGPLAVGSEAVLSPTALPEALRIFYEADRMTYGARHDLLVASGWGAPPTDYRIIVDNREYQQSLSQLQFLTSQASRLGHAVRLKL
jgi:hypothetical protein